MSVSHFRGEFSLAVLTKYISGSNGINDRRLVLFVVGIFVLILLNQIFTRLFFRFYFRFWRRAWCSIFHFFVCSDFFDWNVSGTWAYFYSLVSRLSLVLNTPLFFWFWHALWCFSIRLDKNLRPQWEQGVKLSVVSWSLDLLIRLSNL